MKDTYSYSATIVLLLLVLAFQDLLASSCQYEKARRCKKGFNKDQGVQYLKFENYLCDVKTDDGGWIVFHRRVYKITNFTRTWIEYKNGFGDICTDYYLGNEFLASKTANYNHELRIDMSYNGKNYFAKYQTFKVEGEDKNYTLRVGGFSGDIYNDLEPLHNNMPFSTYDRETNPDSCARVFNAGWWYNKCYEVNLNGEFDNKKYGKGIHWVSLTTATDGLSSVEMKMRVFKK